MAKLLSKTENLILILILYLYLQPGHKLKNLKTNLVIEDFFLSVLSIQGLLESKINIISQKNITRTTLIFPFPLNSWSFLQVQKKIGNEMSIFKCLKLRYVYSLILKSPTKRKINMSNNFYLESFFNVTQKTPAAVFFQQNSSFIDVCF